MSVTLAEQETNVIYGREDARALVYTSDSTTITKLDNYLKLQGAEWKLEKEHRIQTGELIGKTYSCPKEFISFRFKSRKKQPKQASNSNLDTCTNQDKENIIERS